MAHPLYSKDDYKDARLSLLPPGKAFEKEKENKEGNLYQLFDALAEEDAREDERIRALIEEGDPTSANETLEDWERSNGLPIPSASTLQGRRHKLLQALLGAKASTQPPIQFIAQSFGYNLTIKRHDTKRNWSFERGHNSLDVRRYHPNYNHLLVLMVQGAPKKGDPFFEEQIKEVALGHLSLRFVYQ